MYKSCEEDLQWARKGVMASVINGKTIPAVQNRIEDTRFADIDIISLGVDKVFI